MSIQIELQATIADLVVKGKGILAADESLRPWLNALQRSM